MGADFDDVGIRGVPQETSRVAPLLKNGDVVERLKQFRLRWQEDGDLTYLGKALGDALVEIESLRRKVNSDAGLSTELRTCAEIATSQAMSPKRVDDGLDQLLARFACRFSEAARALSALEDSPAGLADAHSKSPSRPAMPKEEDTHG